MSCREGAPLATALTNLSGGAELDSRGRDYDIIVQTVIALEALGGDPDLGGSTLLDILSDPHARVTVFVPRDRAFYKLAKLLGWDGSGGDAGALTTITDTFDLETIRDVVKYHVVPERLGVFQVLFRNSFETVLPGATFERQGLRLVDNDPDIADPYLTLPLQIRGGRSIAHTITRVLIPLELERERGVTPPFSQRGAGLSPCPVPRLIPLRSDLTPSSGVFAAANAPECDFEVENHFQNA